MRLHNEPLQRMLQLLVAVRDALIATSARLVNTTHGVAKAYSIRLPKRSKERLHGIDRSEPFRARTERVREVYGVGEVIAAAFVATVGWDVSRFSRARDAGAYLGLVPRQDQSGSIDRQLHVTKAGSRFMRRLLVEGAGVVLKSNARDTDLKARGLRICLRGGKIAKAKARLAVARGLAVTMLALLMKPEAAYVPLSEFGRGELERIRAEEERRAMAR